MVGIGSNTEPEKNITAALDALEKKYGLLTCSPVYKSLGKTNLEINNNHIYYNLVVSFFTAEDIVTCKKNLQKIEETQGRERNHDDVTCDLDLLLYGSTCTTVGSIQVPHNDITQCDYVLRPLADLMPEQEHPELKKTYKELWQAFQKPTALEPVEFKWQDKLLSIQATCLSL